MALLCRWIVPLDARAPTLVLHRCSPPAFFILISLCALTPSNASPCMPSEHIRLSTFWLSDSQLTLVFFPNSSYKCLWPWNFLLNFHSSGWTFQSKSWHSVSPYQFVTLLFFPTVQVSPCFLALAFKVLSKSCSQVFWAIVFLLHIFSLHLLLSAFRVNWC